MNAEDEEFNRIEREAAMRMEAVSATVAKREWVGLTVEEMNEMTWGKTVYEILALAEAKLREKNT
jgi:S-methylmethionine-dependent homocysteine/selenocysteine methylase